MKEHVLRREGDRQDSQAGRGGACSLRGVGGGDTCFLFCRGPPQLAPQARPFSLTVPQGPCPLPISHLLMELTLGTVSLSQTPSASSRSRISQANMVGFWRL